MARSNTTQASILLIISGGIAAYKSLELVRALKKAGIRVIPVLTKGGAEFITPLSLATLTGEPVHQELFSLDEESEIGHIRLARMADLVVIAPATAHIMAKLAAGLADDLATTILLATDKPIIIAPAMNPYMWSNPATQANIALLKSRKIEFLGPESGDMACGEDGIGRLLDPLILSDAIITKLKNLNSPQSKALHGKKIVITAGPTHEAIDDIRFIANRSSGKQGYAIAQAFIDQGASVTLISGPVNLPKPEGLNFIQITTALEMHEAAMAALPADIAVMAAAVGDWRPSSKTNGKLKKIKGEALAPISLIENPDILKDIANHPNLRPKLVIGFAAEASDALENAKLKYQAKGCDWILLNDVGANPEIFGGDQNQIIKLVKDQVYPWPKMSKSSVANRLAQEVIDFYQ